MKINHGEYYDFDDVMIRPQLSNKSINSRGDVSLVRPFAKNEATHRPYEWEGIPIIAANMDTVGTMEMAEVLMSYNCCTALHKHYTPNDLADFFRKHEENEHLLFYTMGINEHEYVKLMEFKYNFGRFPKNICIDVANGYAPRFADFISRIRFSAPDSIIMAGNVVTGDVTYSLIKAGASIIKVGIGSGSACLTRRVTGVGSPQLSAVMECANVAHGLNALVCSDGGCVYPGDVSKAFGGGADFVMLGGMLSGHDECGGKLIREPSAVVGNTEVGFRDGPPGEIIAMEFYGMSSDKAMEKHNGGMAKYKASEGRTLQVPYKGAVANTIEEILGGVRSTMTYVGALELKELSKCTQFIPHSRQLNTSLVKYES